MGQPSVPGGQPAARAVLDVLETAAGRLVQPPGAVDDASSRCQLLQNCYSRFISAGEVDQALALPAEEVVERLLAIREGQWYERKSGRISSRDLDIPLVALANAEGGTVVVGLSKGEIDGVAAARMNELRQVAHDFTVPVVRMHPTEVLNPGSGRTLLLLSVEPGELVHETPKGECYLRVGDESRRLTCAQFRSRHYPGTGGGDPSHLRRDAAARVTDPRYTQSAGAVRLTLSSADAVPADVRAELPARALEVIDALRVADRPLGTGQVAELLGMARPTAGRYLHLLRDAGLVVWDGESAKDPRATWRLS